jgi:hypothetical protein
MSLYNGEFLFTMGWKFIFLYFLGAFVCSHVDKIAQGQGAKKEVCFFQLLFLLMVLHDVIFNVTAWI